MKFKVVYGNKMKIWGDVQEIRLSDYLLDFWLLDIESLKIEMRKYLLIENDYR